MIWSKKYEKLDDEKLVEYSANGDQKAFETLYDRWSGRMYSYFYKMLWQDAAKSEDMLQELFIKVMDNAETFDQNKRFKTWIYAMAGNMCKNEYRYAEVRSRHAAKVELEYGQGVGHNDADMDKRSFKMALKEELDLLDEKKKAVFILRFKQGLSIKEIAESLECSEGTVKSRIFYTLKHLSERLKEFDPKLIS